MKGILGRKVGMTEVFTKEGKVIPVTVIEVEPNVVTQVKTVETDGYNAIQLSVCDKKEKNATKASVGHAKKANTTPKRFLKEIRNFEGTYGLGDTIKADIFTVGEIVDVTGTSKGKGTQGVIKRYGQHSGPDTHGSRYHRRVGSLGTMRPMRVIPGKKLPGHMGAETVTIQNLEIVDVNLVDNYILVSGNVPGPKKSLVLIKSAVKNNKKADTIELINYEEVKEESVADNVEEVTTETVETPEVETAQEEVVETLEETPAEETPVEEVVETPVEEETTSEEVKEETAEEVTEETTKEEENQEN